MGDQGRDRAPREIVTNSRLKTFRACRKLHHFSYERLRRPRKVPGALSIGTLYHRALENWWGWLRAERLGHEQAWLNPLEAALAGIAIGAGEAMEHSDEVDPSKIVAAERIMRGYDARWLAEVMAEWDVLGVEVPFVAPITNPDTKRSSQLYALGGKIDIVLRRRSTTRIWFGEHKSAGEPIGPDARYWLKLRSDWQVSTYYSGLDTLGVDVEGCLYDVLRKPALEPLKATPEEARKYTVGKACKVCGGSNPRGDAPEPGRGWCAEGPGSDIRVECPDCAGSGWKEAPKLYANQRLVDEEMDAFGDRISASIAEDPDSYFRRPEAVRMESELVEHRWDTWTTVRALHETKLAGHHSRNPDSCFAFNRPCAYAPVCWEGRSIEDDDLYRDAKSPNEELGDFDVSVEALLRRIA